jgi:serine/threonine-protein kinase
VLEPAPRRTLATYLVDAEPDEKFALHMLRQLAQLLEHIHRNGVLHRGLRSNAIHLEQQGDEILVKLSGFELADLAGDPRLAPAGAVFGHPAWMSPEQCRGEELDGRSDLYALGIVLYAMLARRLPFYDPDTSKLLELQREAPPPPIRKPGSPASELDALCLKLLAKDPAARYADATALLEAVNGLRF